MRWREVDTCEAMALGDELPVGHALHGRVARAVARRDDRDDVAFEVEELGLCVVHLTWRRETDPRWPHTKRVASLPQDDGS